jgi:hypothetical protein
MTTTDTKKETEELVRLFKALGIDNIYSVEKIIEIYKTTNKEKDESNGN